jgi:hypothetical protein
MHSLAASDHASGSETWQPAELSLSTVQLWQCEKLPSQDSSKLDDSVSSSTPQERLFFSGAYEQDNNCYSEINHSSR